MPPPDARRPSYSDNPAAIYALTGYLTAHVLGEGLTDQQYVLLSSLIKMKYFIFYYKTFFNAGFCAIPKHVSSIQHYSVFYPNAAVTWTGNAGLPVLSP